MILIAGDSWGVGEWDGPDGEDQIWTVPVSHPGLQFFLCQYQQKVVNLSRPAASNAYSWNACVAALTNNEDLQKSVKCIVFFQTEWHRDLCELWHLADVENLSLEQLRSRWISRTYEKLSRLSVKYDVPVYIIGGAGDTIWLTKFAEEYPGVQIVCQSMTNLLINDEHRIDRPIMCSHYTHHLLMQIMPALKSRPISLEDKMFSLQEIELSNERVAMWGSHREWFFPDGGHPNRYGHQKLFHHLCSAIPKFLD